MGWFFNLRTTMGNVAEVRVNVGRGKTAARGWTGLYRRDRSMLTIKQVVLWK